MDTLNMGNIALTWKQQADFVRIHCNKMFDRISTQVAVVVKAPPNISLYFSVPPQKSKQSWETLFKELVKYDRIVFHPITAWSVSLCDCGVFAQIVCVCVSLRSLEA